MLQSTPRRQNCPYASRRARHERTCGSAADDNLCPIFHCFVLSGCSACNLKFGFRRQRGNADSEFFSQRKKALLPLA